MRGERWKLVPGFELAYQVSDRGRIRRLRRTVVMKNGRIRTFHERVMIVGQQPSQQYRLVTLTHAENKLCIRLGALILLAFCGPTPEGQEVRHLDGDSKNDRLDNLAYGTPAQNTLDKHRHGTVLKGFEHPRCKISTEQREEIRAIVAVRGDKALLRYAESSDIHLSTLYRIRSGRSFA